MCESALVNKGRTIANLESKIYCSAKLVASANGNFAIIAAKKGAS